MKKTVLIIEDNKIQIEMLKKLVLEINTGITVYTASDVKTAYKILMEKTIDVFLVDIILDTTRSGDTSGIRLVERVRTIPKYMFTPVVFITSLEDTTKYAYTDLHCLGYVEKPFSPENVKQLVEKALFFSTCKEEGKVFCFRKDGILYPVKVKNIIYIESRNRAVDIHMVEGGTLSISYKTCKQLLDEVDADCLIQCSRYAIVNKDYVLNVDIANRFITLKGVEEQVEIGITYKKKILAEYGL
ncbi:LytR/AlgR family response regulator transcription factor [Parablautia muri]|uniref:Stage 0 sporulation protein A homolog n=1 Tax=Parablautia muri TaxID=2320879 RepID=A0A9X5BH21_9FIRM|nr:LytTR family DNA-binding domain-containing protein [Parablautia muri]NBJ93785.1 DNA-binding response regulator [Parablautia muri]